MNREQRKTKYDCEWNPRAVRRVLTNSIYCGHYVNHKYEIADYLTGKQVHISPEEYFHHERPEWAIVSPEVFAQAQSQMNQRRTQYDSGEPFKGARYSSKHLFSTLIKCEHCGRSFCRKHYTYVNTRVYWKCTTNDQYTAERCDNTVKLEEADLLSELRMYFASLIQDKEKFMAEVLATMEKQLPTQQIPDETHRVEQRQKELLVKKNRYQEMYANDIISMEELKTQVTKITEELQSLNCELERWARSLEARKHADSFLKQYVQEIERFLHLETMTNMDLRKIIDHISVNKDGNVRIILKKLENMDTF